MFKRIEKKVVDARNGSQSVMLEIQPVDEYQNITLSAETNEKLNLEELLEEKKVHVKYQMDT
jgi:hypothetical protein